MPAEALVRTPLVCKVIGAVEVPMLPLPAIRSMLPTVVMLVAPAPADRMLPSAVISTGALADTVFNVTEEFDVPCR